MDLTPPPFAAPGAAVQRDADIDALLAAGEREPAFEALVARYEHKVWRLCLTLLRDPALAQDAAQDSLLRVWRALPGHDPALGALSTWIYAVTRNRCLTLLARRPPPTASLDDDDDDAIGAEVAALAAPVPDGPDATGRALLRSLVDALPDAQRTALTLFYYEDRSVAEAAAMTGLPEATVKTHLHRARAALRARLAERGLADPALWL